MNKNNTALQLTSTFSGDSSGVLGDVLEGAVGEDCDTGRHHESDQSRPPFYLCGNVVYSTISYYNHSSSYIFSTILLFLLLLSRLALLDKLPTTSLSPALLRTSLCRHVATLLLFSLLFYFYFYFYFSLFVFILLGNECL